MARTMALGLMLHDHEMEKMPPLANHGVLVRESYMVNRELQWLGQWRSGCGCVVGSLV